MIKLLERNILAVDQRLVMLAPPRAPVSRFFRNVETNPSRHDQLVREMQQLRGSVYLDDGAVRRLSKEGLHQTPEDRQSWHLLMMDDQGHVSACVNYLEYDNGVSVDELRVGDSPLARVAKWRNTLRAAVGAELAQARREGLRYAEIGGWAVSKDSRCTSEGLVLALALYSVGSICGGGLGLTTATVRHCSSSILRRIGGSPLVADGVTVPPYFDPKYGCVMELLRFDTRRPSAKFAGVIEMLKNKLADVLVIRDHDSMEHAEPMYHPPTGAFLHGGLSPVPMS